MRVLLLAMHNSKKDIVLLVSVIAISCLIFAPIIYMTELLGAMLYPDSEVVISHIPAGRLFC